jgi:predicted ATPase
VSELVNYFHGRHTLLILDNCEHVLAACAALADALLRDCFEDTRPTNPAALGLVEPLSEREVEVLRLLGTDLSGPEIARELTVSLSAARTRRTSSASSA